SAKVTSKSLESKISLLKKYGGMVILLAMGKEIPETVEERVGIALEGIRILEENGISKERILVDPLVLSMASGKDPTVSLNIIAALSQKGVATSIGLSNLSYGLPNRSGMNGAFLAQAIEKGLTAAILNPGDEVIRKILPGALSLAGVEEHGNQGPEIADPILAAMLSGNREALKTLVDELLREHPPLTVSQQYLGKSMEGLGQLYARNEIYLPQLLLASDTVREIFDFVNQRLDPLRIYKGKVLLATVEGDVHDIGKNIVGTVLKSGGFEVIDLGKDVSAVQIVAKAKEVKPDVVGLSAMMTTTIGEIETVIRALHESGIDKPVIAGGASLNKELAHRFGCSGYAKDAVEGLELCKSLINR
ncbi:MAG: cobalamin-dependent protein, partial [Thermotogota bacterium]|nr:cobalamin-dependent protein [Thermotogota bacterium]